MTRLLIDTSVLIKWFHGAGESELGEARAIRNAHIRGDLDAHVLDLAIYEIGNVLARALKWPATDVGDQIDDLLRIVGSPITMTPGWFRDAAVLAEAAHTVVLRRQLGSNRRRAQRPARQRRSSTTSRRPRRVAINGQLSAQLGAVTAESAAEIEARLRSESHLPGMCFVTMGL